MRECSDDDVLAVPSTVVVRTVGERVVLLNALTGRYFALDELGSHIWRLVASSNCLASVRQTLIAEYDVDAAQLARELEALVERLKARGLLEIRRTS